MTVPELILKYETESQAVLVYCKSLDTLITDNRNIVKEGIRENKSCLFSSQKLLVLNAERQALSEKFDFIHLLLKDLKNI